MTEIATDSPDQSTSHSTTTTTTTASLPPATPTGEGGGGGPSPTTKLHAMSTRSSEALARQQQQQQQQQQPQTSSSSSSRAGLPGASAALHHRDQSPHGLSSTEGRLTRKRARSINVEEANRPRGGDRASLQSPALGGPPSSAASSVSTTSDRICLCPAEPKVKRPRNAFILYRQHNQAAVVHQFPGLANPDISKIIGERWGAEDDATKQLWKRRAEEEKAAHQRAYPEYKYQPRRGGKNGPAALRAAAAAAAASGEDPGRCPKCGGWYISTPRTPSTPFGGGGGGAGGMMMMGGHGGGGLGPITTAAVQHQQQQQQQQQHQQHHHHQQQQQQQPFIMNNNQRVIETVPQHHHQRLSIDSQHGGMGGDPRQRQSSYYPHPHPPEPMMRPIEEDYDPEQQQRMVARRRGPSSSSQQQDDYDMVTSPEFKRRRFDGYPTDRGSPMSAVPPRGQQQQQQHPHQQQQYPMMGGGQAVYPQYPMQQQYPPPPQQQQHHPGSRRGSAISVGGASMYSNHPSSAGGGNYPMGPLMHPRTPIGPPPPPSPREQQQQQQQQQQQSQPQQRDMAMAPPPRPARLNTTTHHPVPPPPPGLPHPHSAARSSSTTTFDESLTLPPLKIPGSSPTTTTTNTQTTSSDGGGGLGGMQQQQQQQQQTTTTTPQRERSTTTIEELVMGIPITNKLNPLRRISPALGPAAAGEGLRGPVIAVEGEFNAGLMREIALVIERALRRSGECDVRVWTSSASSEDQQGVAGLSPVASPPAAAAAVVVAAETSGGGGSGKRLVSEDVEMADVTLERLSVASGGGSRHTSISAAGGGSREGSKTPTPRQPGVGGSNTAPPPTHGIPSAVAAAAATGTSMLDYLQMIMDWHPKSAEIVKHVTTTAAPPSPASPTATTDNNKPNTTTTPVALIADGFSLTMSDRFASHIPLVDHYSPVDHWLWMATLWRGIVGADLVVYVRSGGTVGGAGGGGGAVVEMVAPGAMLVRVGAGGDRVDEKTERRLAFEVMEWVRAGTFREGAVGEGEGGGVD